MFYYKHVAENKSVPFEDVKIGTYFRWVDDTREVSPGIKLSNIEYGAYTEDGIFVTRYAFEDCNRNRGSKVIELEPVGGRIAFQAKE